MNRLLENLTVSQLFKKISTAVESKVLCHAIQDLQGYDAMYPGMFVPTYQTTW